MCSKVRLLKFSFLIGCIHVLIACHESARLNPSLEAKVTKVIPIQQRDSGYQSTPNDWQKFLTCWAARETEHAKEQGGDDYVPDITGLNASDSVKRNIIQSEIARIEKKIDLKLPKSYRNFLEAGGAGFRFSSFESSQRFDQFLPLSKVGWLHEEFPDVYKSVMISGMESDYSSDEDYYHYEDATDPSFGSRDRYLRKILVIGMFAEQGMLLLNPHEMTADGEWEAWEFYWVRTERHLSFAKLARSVFLNTAFDPPRNTWPVSDANLQETCAKLLASRKI